MKHATETMNRCLSAHRASKKAVATALVAGTRPAATRLLLCALTLLCSVASCRKGTTTESPLPQDIESAWRQIERELKANTAIYSIKDTYNGEYLSEYEFKKIGEKWLVRCLRDGANSSGVFTGKTQVRTPEIVFGVKNQPTMTEFGSPYALSYAAPTAEGLTKAQTGLLKTGESFVFAPIYCGNMNIGSLETANVVERKNGINKDHPEYLELTFREFNERVTPFGGKEDPIYATAGRIVVDSSNRFRMVAKEFDIRWKLRGKDTDNIRKQRIEYIDGLNHFVIHGEWEGPASNKMIQRTEVKKLPGTPLPEEFTLAHYGIEYAPEPSGLNWLIPLGLSLALLILAGLSFRKRRGTAVDRSSAA